jgi:hypothetical protein
MEHDLEPLRAELPDDFLLDDHRRAGLGRVEGAGAFIASFAPLFEQSADLCIETLYTVAVGDQGSLDMAHMFGTLSASGGDFESIYVRLFQVREGRLVGLELFEPADLAVARARFEALRPQPNAASRASLRVTEIFASDEWQPALRAIANPRFRFEDRSKRALLDGDIEFWIRNLAVVRAWPGRRAFGESIGRFGDRIDLQRIRFSGGIDGGDFEGEFLRLVETDIAGRLLTVIHFDPEDRSAAFEEARTRFEAGEGAVA